MIPLVIALREGHDLAERIAREARLTVAPLEERSFEEGEFKLRPLVSVRDRTVFVVQSLAGSHDAPVAQRLVRLLFLLFGLRDAGAGRIVALVPYLSFARKDRRTQPRDPVHTRYIAQLLETTGLNHLVTLDVHNSAALDNAFRIPVDHLSALPLFAAYFAERGIETGVAVASPDVGGIKRAQLFREMLERQCAKEVDLVFIEKRRTGGVVSGGQVVGDVDGRTVIVLDDLCATGGTLIRAATALRAAGASAVHVAVTHAPLQSALIATNSIAEILTTDSVGSVIDARDSNQRKLIVLPIAPLLGQAVARVLSGLPLTPLLEHWPPRTNGP